MDETHEHLPSDGLTEDKTDLTRICLTFTLNHLKLLHQTVCDPPPISWHIWNISEQAKAQK